MLPHVLTLVAAEGATLAPEALARNLSAALAPHGIALDRWRWLDAPRAGEWFFPHTGQGLAEAAAALRIALGDAPIDHALQEDVLRLKRLMLSDMDSTLIQQECIDELAAEAGIGEHVAAITARAMRGELDFVAALTERVALLKGLQETVLETVWRDRIRLMPGAATLVATLRSQGTRTVLVSGGFRFFTQRVADALGMDAHFANQLEVTNGALTGTTLPPILDKHSKRVLLESHAQHQGITLHETLALGDGANDLPMLNAAGLGVACHAKPLVLEATHASITHTDLSSVLWFMGIEHARWVKA